MKAMVQLEDFEIEDKWALSKQWPRLIEAKEEYDEVQESQSDIVIDSQEIETFE